MSLLSSVKETGGLLEAWLMINVDKVRFHTHNVQHCGVCVIVY